MFFKFLMVLSLCLSANADDLKWKTKMREVSGALSEVIPYLYPNEKGDVKGLTEKVQQLYEVSQKLDVKDHMVKTGDYDPGLLYLTDAFKEDIGRAYQSLKDGYVDYAKYTLKNSTSYCIACHTRTSSGAQFPLIKAFAEPLKSAPWVSQLEFEAASRQFDSVYTQVMDELQRKECRSLSSLDLERGVRLALSIAVRVKQSPEKTLELAKAIQKSKCTTLPMKEAAKDWEQATRAWKKEKPPQLNTVEAALAEGRRLVKKADTLPSRGNDEVYYLRATAVLHELLRKFPNTRKMPEALFLIGVSYSPLQELGLWNLQENYFQACILEAPHTDIAEKCYSRFEQSVVLGFSGSSGTHIPPQMQRQLQQLKKKAEKSKETL